MGNTLLSPPHPHPLHSPPPYDDGWQEVSCLDAISQTASESPEVPLGTTAAAPPHRPVRAPGAPPVSPEVVGLQHQPPPTPAASPQNILGFSFNAVKGRGDEAGTAASPPLVLLSRGGTTGWAGCLGGGEAQQVWGLLPSSNKSSSSFISVQLPAANAAAKPGASEERSSLLSSPQLLCRNIRQRPPSTSCSFSGCVRD